MATVTVTGEVDATVARALCHRLLKLAAARPERLVLDLGGLVFVDAAGAKALDDTHKLLDAVCPVIVRRPPTWSPKIFGPTDLTGIQSALTAGGPGGDLTSRLETARAQAAANYERSRAIWRRTECLLAENRMLLGAARETRGGWQAGPARPDLLQQSAYARLVARLQTMPVIEQAKGIIMAQSACDDAEAFDMLRRASQRSNVPVRELAAQFVAKSARTAPSNAAKSRGLARGG